MNYFLRSRTGYTELHGPSSPKVISCIGCLAQCQIKVENYSEGIALFREMLEMLRVEKGEDDVATLECMISLGKALKLNKEYSEARDFLKSCSEKQQKVSCGWF
jgi:hypothetical protein